MYSAQNPCLTLVNSLPLSETLRVRVRAFLSLLSMSEEFILSLGALSADLSPSRGASPAVDSKHIESIPNELITQLSVLTAALSVLSPS